eukprot:4984225-Pyramimonas_sp.AAC.1
MLASWQARKLNTIARGSPGPRAARRSATTGIIPRIGYRTKVIPLSPEPLLQLRRSLGRFATSKAR